MKSRYVLACGQDTVASQSLHYSKAKHRIRCGLGVSNIEPDLFCTGIISFYGGCFCFRGFVPNPTEKHYFDVRRYMNASQRIIIVLLYTDRKIPGFHVFQTLSTSRFPLVLEQKLIYDGTHYSSTRFVTKSSYLTDFRDRF